MEAKKVVLYSQAGSSLRMALALQQRAADAGIEVTECAAGRSWKQVVESVGAGDELVLDSLRCFSSLNELLGFVASCGVLVHSLDEPWFSEGIGGDLVSYQCKLYELGSSLHAARTRKGLVEVAKEGRRPGRKLGSKSSARVVDRSLVEHVDRLRQEQQLPAVEACRVVGVSVVSYYRMRAKGE